MTGSPYPTISLPKLTLIIGGARSGKSRLAERLVSACGCPRTYIATAQGWDDEMRARIARHLTDRGDGWQTIEAPLDLPQVLQDVSADRVVLLDCATLWLSNQMLAEAEVTAKIAELLLALAECAAPVVVVSNEVGWSIVPDNALARAFRDHQGRLNQQLAAQAGMVVAVMAGLPIALKGTLPEGVA